MAGDAITAEIEELKKKLSQNPDSLIFVPLADAYRRSGMLDDAVEVCSKGLEKHPSYTSARVVLGRIYLEKDMLNEASEELKKVESVDSDNIMVHSMLGNIYLKKKMYAEAIDQFQRVLSLNPEDVDTQEKLKEALTFKQEPAAQVQPSPPPPKKVEEKKSEPEPKKEPPKDKKTKIDISKSLKAAELYTKKEEFDKAVEIYKEILDDDSENIMVQQRLREVYSLQEKKLSKEKERDKESQRSGEAPVSDKITAEDILDVMKHAVEDEDVEPPPEKKNEPIKEAKKEEKKETKPSTKAEPSKKTVLDPAKFKDIEAILKELHNVDGLIGSLLMSRDGSLIANMLPKNINTDEASKMIATIVEKTEQVVKDTKQGKLNQVVVASQKGQLLFNEISVGVLFMLGDENINVGKMRLVLKDVIEKIKKVAA